MTYRFSFMLLAIIMTLGISAQTQGCLPDGISFSRQGQIDSFRINYPGCTEISGYVSLNGPTIVNLDSLMGLKAIRGFFQISDAPNLTSLSGLEGLSSLNDFQILGSGLYDLTGLQNLDTLNALRIGHFNSFNPSLNSLQGMPKVTSIQSVEIGYSPLLNLHGLENVTNIGTLDILNNANLTSLEGLNQLDSITYHLIIRWNFTLANLNGLQKLRVVGGDLGIWANPLLTSLEKMESLVSVGKWNEGEGLNIFNNNMLSICDINGVCKHIQEKPGTTNISGIAPGCRSVLEVDSLCASNSTAVKDLYDHSEISLFPNPNNGAFTIELPSPATTELRFRIMDLTGRLMHEQVAQSGQSQQNIQANDLPAGLELLWYDNQLVKQKFHNPAQTPAARLYN